MSTWRFTWTGRANEYNPAKVVVYAPKDADPTVGQAFANAAARVARELGSNKITITGNGNLLGQVVHTLHVSIDSPPPDEAHTVQPDEVTHGSG